MMLIVGIRDAGMSWDRLQPENMTLFLSGQSAMYEFFRETDFRSCVKMRI